MASVSDSTTCPGGQCILSFPTVPAGKQLVITNVSAQLGPASNELVLEGNGVSFFVPKSDMNIGYLAPRIPPNCFGTRSEHKLNHLRRPFGLEAASGCQVLR